MLHCVQDDDDDHDDDDDAYARLANEEHTKVSALVPQHEPLEDKTVFECSVFLLSVLYHIEVWLCRDVT